MRKRNNIAIFNSEFLTKLGSVSANALFINKYKLSSFIRIFYVSFCIGRSTKLKFSSFSNLVGCT
jgi:hypothetical protein